MSRTVKHDSTDQSVTIRIIDSSDGTPETGVTSATAGLALWYRREGAASTSITVVDLTALTDAHSDGGLKHINDGYYRLDIPDAAFASGADEVTIGGTATGMIVLGVTIPLVAYDPADTVRLGLTALPNAAADAAGGLPVSDAGGLDLDAMKTSTDKIDNATYGLSALKTLIDTVDTVVDAIKAVTDNLPDSGALSDLAAIVTDTNELQTDWTDGGRLDLLIDAIKAVTDNLPDSGALSDLATLESRLTAARAGYLDNLNVSGLVATQSSTSVGGRLLSTTIASVTSQTEFVLTTGFTNDDMPNNVSYCIITDSSDSNQKAVGYPSDYAATSKTLTLKADPGIFTVAAGDSIEIYAMPNINDVTTAYNNIISVANTPVGQTSGFPTEIITGDAYTVANGRQIKMYFYDSAGNVMTSFGSKSPSDTDFTWAFRMVPATDPDISPVTMEVTGDENDWDTTDPNNPYLVVELPAASTDLLTVDADQLTKEYYWQLVLQWGGGSVYELTAVTNGTVTVRRKYE